MQLKSLFDMVKWNDTIGNRKNGTESTIFNSWNKYEYVDLEDEYPKKEIM